MGMSASQARFLALTARKNNVEYQGQQINQQRLNLANQSASQTNMLLGLSVPTPPSVTDYTKTIYTFEADGETKEIGSITRLNQEENGYKYLVNYQESTTENVYLKGSSVVDYNKQTVLPKQAIESAAATISVAYSYSSNNQEDVTDDVSYDFTKVENANLESLEGKYRTATSVTGFWPLKTKPTANSANLLTDNSELQTFINDLPEAFWSSSFCKSNNITKENSLENLAIYTNASSNKTHAYVGIASQIQNDSSGQYVILTKYNYEKNLSMLQEDGKNVYVTSVSSDSLASNNAYPALDSDSDLYLAKNDPTYYVQNADGSVSKLSQNLQSITVNANGTKAQALTKDQVQQIEGIDYDDNLMYFADEEKNIYTVSTGNEKDINRYIAQLSQLLNNIKVEKADNLNHIEGITIPEGSSIYIDEDNNYYIVDKEGNYEKYDNSEPTISGMNTINGQEAFKYTGEKIANIDYDENSQYLMYTIDEKTQEKTYYVFDNDTESGHLSDVVKYTEKVSYLDEKTTQLKRANIIQSANGQLTNIDIEGEGSYSLKAQSIQDEQAYNEAMTKYEYDKARYEKEIEDINAKTAIIQQQDKSLELKLKQLDTEQKSLSTEIDAVKQVLQKNVESSFKTFS